MKEWYEAWMCPIEDYNCPCCNANGECMMDRPQDECDDFITAYEDITIDRGDENPPYFLCKMPFIHFAQQFSTAFLLCNLTNVQIAQFLLTMWKFFVHFDGRLASA